MIPPALPSAPTSLRRPPEWVRHVAESLEGAWRGDRRTWAQLAQWLDEAGTVTPADRLALARKLAAFARTALVRSDLIATRVEKILALAEAETADEAAIRALELEIRMFATDPPRKVAKLTNAAISQLAVTLRTAEAIALLRLEGSVCGGLREFIHYARSLTGEEPSVLSWIREVWPNPPAGYAELPRDPR